MAELNLIKKTDVANARVREIDFTLMFEGSIKKLVEVLGITRKVAKQSGYMLKSYVASGTLADGVVAEGETIPLSKYTVTPISYKEIVLKKWRKRTSAEAILDKGYDQAIEMTNDAMIRDVQKSIRKSFFDSLKATETDSTGTVTTATNLQGALAKAWGELQVLFEDDDISMVFFANPLDVADYLAKAQISTQTAFGMSYVENFLGLGTLILNSSVPQEKIYATAKDNLVLYYISSSDAGLNEAFSFTSDETGYIGIHESADYTNMTASNTVVSGVEIFAEKPKGVVTVDFSAPLM